MQENNWTEEQIAQSKYAFMHMAKHLVPQFVVDEHNREIINDLFYYFHKLEGGHLDQSKGLWLAGDIGTGKSTLMQIFSNHLRSYWNDSAFKIYNCTTIANEFAYPNRDKTDNQNADALDRYTYNRYGHRSNHRVAMCFDELGREPIPAVHFGQRLNVMEYILHIRYSFWQTEGLLTYVTTNLSPEEVEEKYHDYIRDRRAEMFNLIAMTGKSRRG